MPGATPTPTNPAPTGPGVYLSDLNWTSATNGYGPVEKDKSNGEANAGDGRTITLKRQTYTKGLGVHASSSISYNLGAQYTQFITDMGLDDEITNAGCGTIEFQIFLDGNKVYSSGIVNAATATKSVTLDVSGRQTLTLVVTDGGDGAACDHGDWAGARLIPSGGATTTPVAGNGSGNGLRGDYYPNTTLSGSAALTRRDDTVNFEWSDGSPAAGRVGTDNFSVRWTGQVEAPVTGSYTFSATTDDGVRLWVNGTQLIDQWVPQGPTLVAGKVLNLTAGQRYDIRMEYFEYGGGATAKLLWSYPGQGQQTIPQSRLYSASIGSGRQAVSEESRTTMLVYPVPAQETVWVRYDAQTAGTATVQLVSLAGQAVLQTEQAVTAGENTIRLAVRSLNRGSYVLILMQGNQRQTQKLILTE